MADFLVEIGTEELPPKALSNLSSAFESGIVEGLKQAKLNFSASKKLSTPRRLAVLISGLDAQQADQTIEKLGPNVKAAFDQDGNPTKAAQGFARGFGVEVSELLQIETDKGTRLGYRSEQKGESAESLLPNIIEQSLSGLPIPKRMRWGASRAEFVRPIHWVIMLLDNKVIDAEIMGIKAGNETRGHRFHYNQTLSIATPSEYESTLANTAYVLADSDQRKQKIVEQVTAAGEKLGGIAQIDDDLLDEVTGLVEWPVALAGKFDDRFLDVPAEALVSSMKEHQKYFHVNNADGDLLANFITVSNIESIDPAQVIDGNERVIRPRLHDAAFFFETDKKTSLHSKTDKLKTVVFQEKLGTIYDKTQRIKTLAVDIAEKIGGNRDDAARAASLSKADLVTEMVFEFTDLQGIMGYHYALHDGENIDVALALNEQYLPKGAGDSLPTTATGSALAIADRIDTLVGIFGIGQPPTGNKDPFALRRAALGVLNIIVQKQLPLDLRPLLERAKDQFTDLPKAETVVEDVLAYMIERFRAWYQGEGIATEVFLAVQAKNISDPVDFDQRIKAVHAFSELEAAQALAAANKRVSNILAKLESPISGDVDDAILSDDAEKQLASAVKDLDKTVQPLLADRNYSQVLAELASLREPVDTFFDQVMVMADDEAVKTNRLRLLNQLRGLFLQIADISLLVPAK